MGLKCRCVTGSSPLTRGKPPRWGLHYMPGGLIPAHAGKTTGQAQIAGPMRAHPRSRGENLWRSHASLIIIGSSPLTRGKLTAVIGVLSQFGLIPAHAGKTASQRARADPLGAHPRSRGENEITIDQEKSFDGSSPLTRGKREAETGERVLGGLIPAHAGKTRPDPSTPLAPTAHPRSRGENGWQGSPLV